VRASTIDDVRVVCANCHYVIHRDPRRPMDVDKLKGLLARSGPASPGEDWKGRLVTPGNQAQVMPSG
jgi:hypothetical protein